MSFNESNISTLLASSRAAEEALVWCIMNEALINNEKPHLTLPSEYFNDGKLKIIYTSIKELCDKNIIPEPITLVNYLTEKWVMGKEIRQSDIDKLLIWSFSLHNKSRYEFAVKDNFQKIQVERLLTDMKSDETRDSASLLKYAEKLVKLAQESGWATAKWLDRDDINSLYEFICENQWKDLYWFSWGVNFRELDRITKGIRKGKTYRIGAPSNTGKSQLVYTIINNLLAQKAKVMFVTLENSIETTLSFILSNYQKVQNDDITNMKVEWDWDYLDKNKENLCIVQDVYDLNGIFSKVVEFSPDVVILDYIWLMSIKGFTNESKYEEYAIQVQRFVKTTQVAWIDLSNLPTNLQSTDDIRWNPQFFWSTFLRNNTDVGIHIMVDKEFYEARDKILANSTNQNARDMVEKRSWLVLYVSKNRLWPHSISWKYILDHTRWWEWKPYDNDTIKILQWYSL